MEVDHIIPKISRDESFKNKSIACRQCNISYKSKYNPALEIGYNKKREDYISQVRKYVLEKREENNLKLKSIKELFAQI
jgi:5-methylcytosine-specific restriction endonuclease McrA